jgi:polysaccharide biosynthesis protein PslG
MTANGDAHKQIWATEYGAPTGGPGPIATIANGYNIEGSPDHVDETLQAKIAADSVAAARKLPWLGPLFWYSYLDEGTSANDVENFFGLLRANGSRKPAYDAFSQAVRN